MEDRGEGGVEVEMLVMGVDGREGRWCWRLGVELPLLYDQLI